MSSNVVMLRLGPNIADFANVGIGSENVEPALKSPELIAWHEASLRAFRFATWSQNLQNPQYWDQVPKGMQATNYDPDGDQRY